MAEEPTPKPDADPDAAPESEAAPQADQPQADQPDDTTDAASQDPPADNQSDGGDANVDSESEVGDEAQVTGTPEFQDLQASRSVNGNPAELNRLYDVQVTISAELGRTRIPVQELLTFGEGSIFELNRSVSSPIELIAQGVPLGNGEVVVVDDTFAIRIKEIYANPT